MDLNDVLFLVLLLEFVFCAGVAVGVTISHRRAMKVLQGGRDV